MAMLAERRQKVKWVLNPRQTAWSNDSSKFGQKYLEKLGWKSGQGIGANLQGCTEHVKVSVRSDNRGVGFKGVPEDVLPHQNDFSSLLAQLATDSPAAGTEASGKKSLEAKSRQSKARVHYHKFTRSKDLSVYSQKDLACILGKPTRQTEQPEPLQDSTPSEPNFIQRGNMQAYFTEKMKKTYVNFVKEDTRHESEEDVISYTGFGFDKNSATMASSEGIDNMKEVKENIVKSKKKRKKSDRVEIENVNIGQEADCSELVENVKEARKKGKSRRAGMTETEQVNHIETSEEAEKCFERPRKKQKLIELDVSVVDCDSHSPHTQGLERQEGRDKSRHKKKSGKLSKTTQSENIGENNDSQELLEIKPVDLLESVAELPVYEKKSKKSKKRQKSLLLSENVEVFHSEDLLLSGSDEGSSENKDISGSKKRKVSINHEALSTSDTSETVQFLDGEINDSENIKKSRKKRRLNKQSMELQSNKNDGIIHVPVTASVLNENINKVEKKRKKSGKFLEEVDSDKFPAAYGTENVLLPSDEMNACESSIKLEKTREKYEKQVRKKKKMASSGESVEIPLPDIGDAEPLLTQEQCHSDAVPFNCESDVSAYKEVNECNLTLCTTKKHKKLKKTERTVEPTVSTIEVVSMLSDNYDVCNKRKNHKSKGQVIVYYEGVKYVNGISEHNHHLPRRCWYSPDAAKCIPHGLVFDGFPGSNVEQLGYG